MFSSKEYALLLWISRVLGHSDPTVNPVKNGLILIHLCAVWQLFCETFNFLPIAAIVASQIFCIHGGISPHLNSVADIAVIPRPQDVPEEGLFCDLLWADPDPDVDEWTANERGTSYCFGKPQVDAFLRNFEFTLICRAHQLADDGYEFPLGGETGIVTLFSAPNYCYEYGNQAAIMHVDAALKRTFVRFQWEEAPRIALPVEEGGSPRESGGSEGRVTDEAEFAATPPPAAPEADEDSDDASDSSEGPPDTADEEGD
jgi:diadenosine tetraphosphatase ApaH/serine/threonine PP2A family protein phosphatase